MAIFAFIWHTILITPQVLIRFIPYLLVYGLLAVGIMQSTENIYVIAIVMFVLNTYGIAMLFLLGIRAGLVAVKATTPAVAGGMLNSATRILFFHMLLQLVLVVILLALIYALFIFVLGPSMAPDAMREFELLATLTEQDRGFSGFTADAMAQLTLPATIAGGLYVIGLGGIIAVFGIPMAAVAANAVHHSPKNDMIMGMGRYWLPQAMIYWLFNLPPFLLLMNISPDQLLFLANFSAPQLTGMVIGIYVFQVFATCASYSAMAIGYALLKDETARIRAAESRPEFDYEAERENLKSLRAQRTSGRSGASVYDPVSAGSSDT